MCNALKIDDELMPSLLAVNAMHGVTFWPKTSGSVYGHIWQSYSDGQRIPEASGGQNETNETNGIAGISQPLIFLT